jgi:serine/threonine protein kinase
VVAGRYRLVRMLGSGGMGTVWLAHDLSLDSQCALKLIDDDKAASEEVRIRFEREARAAAQVRGAHVVDIFDHGEHEGVPFIAMEYLEGEDLEERLRRLGRLDAESTYRVIAHVARALVRAHSLGIVHRDLKPENIFLVQGDEHEIAKVLDFGIAKHDTYSLRDKATKTGSFLGTPFYVSPEQARGKVIDYRSDLWSLGVIAFQCLTGRPPFESEALGELMGLILYEDLPKPTERNPELPPALDEWWQRAAARDPEERFQSAKAWRWRSASSGSSPSRTSLRGDRTRASRS